MARWCRHGADRLLHAGVAGGDRPRHNRRRPALAHRGAARAELRDPGAVGGLKRLRCSSSSAPEEEYYGQQCQEGVRGEGDGADDPNTAPHLRRLVEAGKRFVRFGYAEELAQRTPALPHLVDQQPPGWYAASDFLGVSLEDLYGVGPVLEAAVEGAVPDDLVRQTSPRGLSGGKQGEHGEDYAEYRRTGHELAQLVDAAAGAIVPTFGIAHAEQHLRLRMPLHKLLVEGAGWPVHGGLVTPEYPFPVDRLPPPCGEPETRVFGVREDLGHVVARTEAQFLEGHFERQRARPAEAGADDFHASS